MTTAVPLPARTAEVCRLTVEAPDGRADLAVPVTTPVSALLPVLLRPHRRGTRHPGHPWTLQRLGEDPSTPRRLPRAPGCATATSCTCVRPRRRCLPLHFDDVSDGVAHTVGSGPGRWRPDLTRQLGLALACLALAALAAALLGAGPGPLTAATAGVIALVLAAGCASAARMHAVPGAILVSGVGAFGFAALAGTTLREGPAGWIRPGTTGILVAAGCVVALVGGLLALGALPLVVPGTVLLTAVAAAVGA